MKTAIFQPHNSPVMENRRGEQVTVGKKLESYDIDEGPMFMVTFSDGTMTCAFEHELKEAN
jgi:hypothetical protein